MARLAYPAIAMAAILLVGLAFQPLQATHPHKASPKTPNAQAPTVSILLNGFVNGWNFSTNPNPRIPVHVGDLVSLNLVSSDTALHLFIVDVDRDGSTTANCPTVDPCSAGFTTRTTYNFTVSFGLGTYTYYCAIHPATMLKLCGHRHPRGRGRRTQGGPLGETARRLRSSCLQGLPQQHPTISEAARPSPAHKALLTRDCKKRAY